MGLTASLDMGAEKMVMALGSIDYNACRLMGIKFFASQGMERGMMKDKTKVRTCVRHLLTELAKDREIENLNISLSGDAVQMREHKVNITLSKKVVEEGDLYRAEQDCSHRFGGGEEELVDIIPVAYSIDRGDVISNPLGKFGRELEVVYQVYTAKYSYLTEVRGLFEGCGVRNISFFPVVCAYNEALDVVNAPDFALVDLGAKGINVVLFRDGMLEYEACLPLGCNTIDTDIMQAFGVNAIQAKKMKYEYAQALRTACKNKKIQIPDTKSTLESRDLATVVQSRAEELLEGVVYLLQNWGYDKPEELVLLTGGGSKLKDIDVLLHCLSAYTVERAVAKQIQSSKEEILGTPEYLIALGLLVCKHTETEKSSGGMMGKIKGFFGI